MILFWYFLRLILETDTSGVRLGAILAQTCEDRTTHPIAYASKTLQQQLKALGVVWAVKYFHRDLYGHHI